MAQFQINLRYQTPIQKVGFMICCFALPFWSLFIPALLGIFIRLYFDGDISATPTMFWIVFGVLLSLMFTGLFLTALFEDDRLYLTKEGIAFPLMFLPSLNFRRTKLWKELTEIDYISSGNQSHLIIGFKDTKLISLDTALLNPKDLEQLLLSLEMYGKDIKTSAAFIAYNDAQKIDNSSNALSYTKMWEDELSRRFSNTAFIPLDPGYKLKNGSLEIVRQIAFGGFSAIYLAQYNQKDLVVLKEIVIPNNVDETTRNKALENFKREAFILSKLEHPNIVRVQDFFVEDSRQYLMMDYQSGQDLRQYVNQNGLIPETQAIQLGLKIATAIEYLHKNEPPILHKDISPDNIILKNDGDILIIDFGAANEFMGTATGTLIGKQAYMSCEQLQGRANLASDIYSFGATLYFLITGRDPLPLAASNIKDVLPEANQQITDFILKCTAFDLADRFQTIDDVLNNLKLLLPVEK